MRALLQRLRRRFSRIGVRMLLFNLLLVFLPVAGLLYLDTYEQQLLRAQEQTMVQQGRVLAAALSGQGELDSARAGRILLNLDQRLTSRLRVIDADGQLVADSSRLGPRASEEPEDLARALEPDLRANPVYRLGAVVGAALDWLRDRVRPSPGHVVESQELMLATSDPLDGLEVRAALAGRYGAATRVSPGQRSVTLYSAVPIFEGDRVIGAVLVSQSTLRLLRDLYQVRLAIFQAFLASIVAAVVLTLLASTTISRPLRRLRREALALIDRRGRLTGVFAGSKRLDEIGDLARALADLSRRLAERLGFIESFAADVSHEFKNPLASIRSATEMIAVADTAEERGRFVRLVQGEVARLERLLTGVREISHIDAQLESEARSAVPLDLLARDLLAGFATRAAQRGVELKLNGTGETLLVEASPDRLAQVIENLLSNALTFAPPGNTAASTVAITVFRDGREAVLLVEDSGPGIPPEHLDRIFDRFFSYRPQDGSAKRHHSGLGLSIVKALVEGYGGSIHAENRAEGGARFVVRLPAL